MKLKALKMSWKAEVLTFVSFICFVSSEIVGIEDGKILGTSLLTKSGKSFFAFYQIPFAQPPINELRFQAPQPVTKWNGILNGTQKGPSCFQPDLHQGMSEDCLQLNVYTKNLTATTPVIVYIHEGAFEYGRGTEISQYLS